MQQPADTPKKALTARQKRLALAAVIAVLVAAFFIWALRPRPVFVDIAAVTRGALTVQVTEEARTRVREVYTLSAPIAGRLERVTVEPGDPVQAGTTVVARIRPTEPGFRDRRTQAELASARDAAQAARAAAEADLRRAEAEFVRAQNDFDRDQRLQAIGTIAQARMDNTRAARDVARAARDAAQSGLRAREADLARAEAALIDPSADDAELGGGACCIDLRAPVDGVVMRVLQESETVLNSGMPIVDIGDPEDLEIYSEMLSSDAVVVSAGARVRIDGWGGEELLGHVQRVEPAAFTKVSALGIEEQRVNVIIDIDSPRQEWGGLGHDFRVDVHVETWRGEDVVRAPDAGVFRQGENWAAFVVDAGRARLRPVDLGRSNGAHAEVVAGLEPGDVVVVYPPDSLTDGDRLRDRASAQGQAADGR